MVKIHRVLAAAGALAVSSLASLPAAAEPVAYKTIDVNGLNIFYREAGPASAPTVLLLHGFPSSSHMYRNLIPDLAAKYHVIAPDYPGFGHSSAPTLDAFDYTFANLANVVESFTNKLGLTSYVLYMQDYGGPVGMRLAIKYPERVRAIVVQNAVVSIEGWHPTNTAPLQAYWKSRTPQTEAPVRDIISAEGTKWQYVTGAPRADLVSPDSWTMDQAGLDRPGNDKIQLELLYQYRDNVANYPNWQAFLKALRPPMLIMWGKNDPVFTVAGMEKFKSLVPDAEVHILDAGHFALETHEPRIAAAMLSFLGKRCADTLVELSICPSCSRVGDGPGQYRTSLRTCLRTGARCGARFWWGRSGGGGGARMRRRGSSRNPSSRVPRLPISRVVMA